MRVKWELSVMYIYQVVQVVTTDRRIFMILGGFGETPTTSRPNRLYTAWEDIP